jgi:hypothetical protein
MIIHQTATAIHFDVVVGRVMADVAVDEHGGVLNVEGSSYAASCLGAPVMILASREPLGTSLTRCLPAFRGRPPPLMPLF